MINVCIANKQLLKRREDTHGQRAGKIKHEALRSVNYRATQNKNNIGTTALERSVVYTIKPKFCEMRILESHKVLRLLSIFMVRYFVRELLLLIHFSSYEGNC